MFLTRLPVEPEMPVELVPAETVRAVLVPRAMTPPLSVAIEDVAPFRLSVPVVRVVMVATPPTVVEPLDELKVVIPAAPVMVFVPAVMEVEVSEPALTVPPPKVLVSKPATSTVPAEIPFEVIVAAERKRVLPAPESEARVIVPEAPLKSRASAVVFKLDTAPTERPAVLEIVAVPLALRSRVAAVL